MNSEENENKSRDGEDSVSGKGESEGEEAMVTNADIARVVFRDFFYPIVGLIVSVSLFYYSSRTGVKLQRRALYSLIPLVLSLVIFYLRHAPRPVANYTESILTPDPNRVVSQFEHRNSKGWPFVGATVINIEGRNHLFVGGGDNQRDALLVLDGGEFKNVIERTNIEEEESNTYSAVSFDINDNGHQDLFLGRKDGVFLYLNRGGYRFEKIQLVGERDKVPLALSVGDYDRDGRADLYISYFTPIGKYRGSVFNDPSHGRFNMLLRNESPTGEEIRFRDVTERTNAGGSQLNTFTSAMVDLNRNGYLDIVLSHDSGEVELLINRGPRSDGEIVFTRKRALKGKGNWMGIAVGDVTGNGYPDLFLTNIGVDVPKDKFALGDIRKDQKQLFRHVLLINRGNYQLEEQGQGQQQGQHGDEPPLSRRFRERSEQYGISGTGFGWGAIFADTDLDGDLDLLFVENTMLFPIHHVFPQPSHFYQQVKGERGESGEFKREFKYNNSYFGQTPMYFDFNGDGNRDVVWVNMNGPVNAYLGENRKGHNSLTVKLPKNSKFSNAKVVLDTGKKKMYRENITGGVGLGSDGNSGEITFGLKNRGEVKEVTCFTP